MFPWEYFSVAWAALTSNKLRSALTLLGMVIGVFSVIASVTAVSVIEKSFDETIDFLGSASFSVQKFPAVQLGRPDESVRNRPNITYEQLELLQRRAELPLSVSGDEVFAQTSVRFADLETNPTVPIFGSDEHWMANNSFELDEGRFLTNNDVQFARPVAVIGAALVKELFPNQTPIGKEIVADGARYKVIGTLVEKGQSFGADQDNRLVVPITRSFSIYGNPQRNVSITVRAHSVDVLAATIDEVIGKLRVIRDVGPLEDNNFEVVTNDSIVDTFTSFTQYLTIGGAFIGLIALLTAGIGIMNIMLVSVTERTREIGIRKSIGAKRKDVLRQFLIEAIFLCQIGGLLGILLGVGVGNMLAILWETPANIPWGWAFGAVMAVTFIALVFGVYPAWKAARLDPIEALRFE